MPRTSRASQGGYCYHVLNRGNGRADVFHKDDDYRAFLHLMGQASGRLPMRVVAYCLMPNHFHLVLWPHADGDLSRWMQWLMTTHVRRYHKHHGSSGHVWQGRFKAFPIQKDEHLLTVIRYVERNALRANLAKRAESWPWSSLTKPDADGGGVALHEGPCPRGEDWHAHVNRPQSDAELKALRQSSSRGTPFGGSRWQALTAGRLGLESTLRPRGRPRKTAKK
jgi:putative transposase